MNVKGESGRTILHRLVIDRNFKLAREVVISGDADLNMKDDAGHSPIFYALENCRRDSQDENSENLLSDLWLITAMIEKGANGRTKDAVGSTILNYSSQLPIHVRQDISDNL
ncbi:MAG: hypothetical protein JWQ35_691 [Bacteriovoracaceae bacterium]|nr:hypothetical protein [Bacteriovoracaceae bacterium]